MINEQIVREHWNEIRSKLRTKWGQLTDEDLKSFDGNVDRLIDMIQKKTGEGRQPIDRFLTEVSEKGASVVDTAREAVGHYAQQAGDGLKRGAAQFTESMHDARDALQESYGRSEKMVRRHPLQSVTTCFGVGVVTGLVVALMLHRN